MTPLEIQLRLLREALQESSRSLDELSARIGNLSSGQRTATARLLTAAKSIRVAYRLIDMALADLRMEERA